MGIFGIFKKSHHISPLSDQAIMTAAPSLAALIDKAGSVFLEMRRSGLNPKSCKPWIDKRGVLDIDLAFTTEYPSADPVSCPHCGNMRDTPARRGQQCAACGKRYIVRRGKIYPADAEKQIYSYFQSYDEYQRDYEALSKSLDDMRDDKSSAFPAVIEGAKVMIHRRRYDDAWHLLNEAYFSASELDDYFSSIEGLQNWSVNVARVRELQAQLCAHQASNMSRVNHKMALRAIALFCLWIHEYAQFYDRDREAGAFIVNGEEVVSIFHESFDNVHDAISNLSEMVTLLKINKEEIKQSYQRAAKLTGGEKLRGEVLEFLNRIYKHSK